MSGHRILIVEGGWQRGALAAVRSLGRAGHHVAIASETRGHSARSRYAKRWFQVPAVGSGSFVERVAAVAAGGNFEMVFAGDDETLLYLSEHRDALGPVLFPYVGHDKVRSALDKVGLYAAAREAGLAVPETSLDPPSSDLFGWIAKERVYSPGSSHEHLAAGELAEAAGRDLVFQRVVAGRLLALVTLTSPAGELLYVGAQRAEAVFPEPFGVSVRARSVAVDPGMAPKVENLLQGLGWFGIAELQFIEPPSGEPLLIDFNGRFFGSLALSAAAGIDLPSAWVSLALGAPVTLAAPTIGARYQWLEGDLRRAAASSAPLKEILPALRFAPGAAHSLWSADDPSPALRLAGDLARRAVSKLPANKTGS